MICRKCEIDKNIDDFRLEPIPSNPLYRRKTCKACNLERVKNQRRDSGYWKKRYKKMSDLERAEYIKKKSEQNQRRFKTNPEALVNKKKYDKSDKGVYKRYINECNRRNRLVRGIKMELTFEEFSKLITSNCYYCGVENCRGVDRLDSDGNYTVENSQPCCSSCNEMKNNKTEVQFIEHLKKIMKNRSFYE